MPFSHTVSQSVIWMQQQKITPSQPPAAALPEVFGKASFRMLNNVRVVDLTTSIAGPYATMLLADFGAEVLKVERKEGDDARYWGPPFLDGESLWFLAVNRNKKSMEIGRAQV